MVIAVTDVTQLVISLFLSTQKIHRHNHKSNNDHFSEPLSFIKTGKIYENLLTECRIYII
jgi:hypothetical protein